MGSQVKQPHEDTAGVAGLFRYAQGVDNKDEGGNKNNGQVFQWKSQTTLLVLPRGLCTLLSCAHLCDRLLWLGGIVGNAAFRLSLIIVRGAPLQLRGRR